MKAVQLGLSMTRVTPSSMTIGTSAAQRSGSPVNVSLDVKARSGGVTSGTINLISSLSSFLLYLLTDETQPDFPSSINHPSVIHSSVKR